MRKIICDICHSEMVFKERIKSPKHYRIRRFICEGCGHQQTIFADGYFDLEEIPKQGINQIEREYKREQTNRTS